MNTSIERAIDLLTPLADQQPVADTIFCVVVKGAAEDDPRDFDDVGEYCDTCVEAGKQEIQQAHPDGVADAYGEAAGFESERWRSCDGCGLPFDICFTGEEFEHWRARMKDDTPLSALEAYEVRQILEHLDDRHRRQGKALAAWVIKKLEAAA